MLNDKFTLSLVALLASPISAIAVRQASYGYTPSQSTSLPAPTNVICNVNYATNPANQAIIESCCKSAGGFPINFKEAKIEGCQNLILRSTANYKFVGCVQDKLHVTPACSNADPVVIPTSTQPATPTTPAPTNVICNVDYSKKPSNQPIIEACCKSAGGYPINFKEAGFEGCQNLILRSTANYKFVGCVQDKLHITPACQNADPVPVNPTTTTTAPQPTLTPVYCDVDYSKKAANKAIAANCCKSAGGKTVDDSKDKIERCENLILRGDIFNKYVYCVQIQNNIDPACYPSSNLSPTPSPSASAAPVPTKVICTADYSKKPSNQPIIEACCKSAGGTPENFKEAKFEGCRNLILGSKAQNAFVSCVRQKVSNNNVMCQTE